MKSHAIINDLIESSFEELRKIGVEGIPQSQEVEIPFPRSIPSSKLIFPKKSNGEVRISEQEIRFLFARELEKLDDPSLYYSVETPTTKVYRFSVPNEGDASEYPKITSTEEEEKEDIDKGQSASIDLTIYKKHRGTYNRAHLIEFKYDNVDTIKKDFLKLLCDDKRLSNYFVHVLNNANKRTFESVLAKYKEAITHVFPSYKKTSNLFIYLYILGRNYYEEEIYQYVFALDKEEVLIGVDDNSTELLNSI